MLVWTRSVSSYEAYLRTYRASIEEGQVIGFLLQSRELPRSVLHGLDTVESLLAELDMGELTVDVRRMAGRLRSTVEYADFSHVRDRDLQDFLESIEGDGLELARSIESTFFRPTGPIYMHSYEVF